LLLQSGITSDIGMKLTSVKSRRGLSNPSQAVIDLLLVAETVFQNAGSGLVYVAVVENYVVKLVDDQIAHSSRRVTVCCIWLFVGTLACVCMHTQLH
jgi:hypothetical protein